MSRGAGEHTPTPAKVVIVKCSEINHKCLAAGHFNFCPQCGDALSVLAVNSHQKLVEALRELKEAAGDLENDDSRCPANLWANLQSCIAKAEAALAAAGEKL